MNTNYEGRNQLSKTAVPWIRKEEQVGRRAETADCPPSPKELWRGRHGRHRWERQNRRKAEHRSFSQSKRNQTFVFFACRAGASA